MTITICWHASSKLKSDTKICRRINDKIPKLFQIWKTALFLTSYQFYVNYLKQITTLTLELLDISDTSVCLGFHNKILQAG